MSGYGVLPKTNCPHVAVGAMMLSAEPWTKAMRMFFIQLFVCFLIDLNNVQRQYFGFHSRGTVFGVQGSI